MLFKKEEKKQTICTIVGFCWEATNAYPMHPETYSCMAKAMKRIRQIMAETEAEAAEMDYGCSCEWKRDFHTLEIKFDNGMIENWIIYETEVK